MTKRHFIKAFGVDWPLLAPTYLFALTYYGLNNCLLFINNLYLIQI